MAMENPDRFVLKPQREGGGNNMYGDEIKEVCCKKEIKCTCEYLQRETNLVTQVIHKYHIH